jgi:hypothetical protein
MAFGDTRKPLKRTPMKRSTKPRKRTAVSPASPAQRAKVKDAVSIVSGQGPCDPAHLVSRALGGCDDERCVVPLTRHEHRLFDAGQLDLAPFLTHHLPELKHALEHTDGSLLRLVHIVTGKRHVPKESA